MPFADQSPWILRRIIAKQSVSSIYDTYPSTVVTIGAIVPPDVYHRSAMRFPRILIRVLLLAALGSVTAACGGGIEAPPTATPTRVPVLAPTAPALPTAGVLQASPTASSTAEQPTDTPTAVPPTAVPPTSTTAATEPPAAWLEPESTATEAPPSPTGTPAAAPSTEPAAGCRCRPPERPR